MPPQQRDQRTAAQKQKDTVRFRNSELRGGIRSGDGDGVVAGTRRAQSGGEIAETAAGPRFLASEAWVAVLDKSVGYGSVNRSVIVHGQRQSERARRPQCVLEIEVVAVQGGRVLPPARRFH